MKKPLETLITPGPIATILPIIIGVFFWVTGYVSSPEPDWNITQTAPFANWLNTLIPTHSIVSHVLGFIFTILIGLFLVQFNEVFSFIRTRTMLPYFFFIILMGSNINTHEFSFGQISCIFLLLALWQVFSIYQQRNPVKQTFNIGFFLALASFFTVEIIFFIPIFWFGMIRLNSFTLKTFLASLLGFICPYSLFLSIAYLQSDVMTYVNLISNQFHFEFSFFNHSFVFILYIGTITIESLFAILNLVNRSFSDKIKVSRMLGFVSICFVFSIVLFLFMSNKSAIIFTLTGIFSSILYAHYFSLHYNVFIRIMFWIQMSISALFFLSSIFFK
jgi:hypothetical protein